MGSMNDGDRRERGAASQLDVLVRAGLLLALVYLCYRIFAPFVALMLWAVILAVTLHPLQLGLARRCGGRQGLAATIVVIVAIALLIVPAAILMSSLGDSIRDLVHDVQTNALNVPPPPAGVENWPVVGPKLHDAWALAHANLPAFIDRLQPKIGDLAREALAFVAGIGGGILQLVAALAVAGVVMAYGDAGARSSIAIFSRVVGRERGERFAALATATIRAVAQGVVGVAAIQAIVIGLSLLLAGVPWAGALALVALVLGIAQVPALVVILPAIAYLWTRGDHGTAMAVVYTALLLVSGMVDNVLKPLMLGRGVDAPMPVVLLGALGGMAASGILGMFVGATLLALGYRIFMGWVGEQGD